MDDPSQVSKITKPARKKYFLIGIILLVVICAVFGGVGYFYISDLMQYDLYGSGGPYTIEKVVLTNKLDVNGQPVSSVDIFRPSDTIIGWVGTKGAEGIIGFRFFYEDEMIFERFGKTQDNQIFASIQSNNTLVLPEGNYRLEIGVGETPHEVLEFTIERYRPEVVPVQPTPIGHQNEELSAYVEVPFAFDEIWTIKGQEWKINEVKIVFLDGTEFVTVAVITDVDISKLSESQILSLSRPIAAYAVKEGYIDIAESLVIDGKSYNLGKKIYINLVNKDSYFYRTEFEIADLLEPTS